MEDASSQSVVPPKPSRQEQKSRFSFISSGIQNVARKFSKTRSFITTVSHLSEDELVENLGLDPKIKELLEQIMSRFRELAGGDNVESRVSLERFVMTMIKVMAMACLCMIPFLQVYLVIVIVVVAGSFMVLCNFLFLL